MAVKLDPNFLYIRPKAGNKITAPNKAKNVGMKSEMLVDYLEPSEWDTELWLSDYERKVYPFIKVQKSWKPIIIQALNPIEVAGKERERSGYINFKELETLTGIPGLESDILGGSSVPIIDGTRLSPSIIKDSSKRIWEIIKDVNAVSSGTFTIGSGGGDDYSTISGATADIANLTALLEFLLNSNIIDTGTAAITEALGGFTLRFGSNSPHNGDPTSGHVASFDGITHAFPHGEEGPGISEVRDIQFKRINTTNLNTLLSLTVIATSFTALFHDLLFDLNAGVGRYGFRSLDPTPVCNFYNMLFWDADWYSFLLDANDGNASSIYENITSLNPGRRSFSITSNPGTFRNTYGEAGSQGSFHSATVATGRNNSSDDTGSDNANWSTGTGNVPSTPTSEFESVSDASSDFAKVKSGALSTAGAAVAIAGNIAGIRGNAGGRGGATPSIGSDEFPVVAGGTSGASKILMNQGIGGSF